MGHDGIGVTMAKTMFILQPIHQFHVLHVFLALNQLDPMRHRLPIFLFNRREIGCRALGFRGYRHDQDPKTLKVRVGREFSPDQ